MNPFVKVPVPLVLVTTTLAAPAACAGVVALILVVLLTTTPVALVPPIVTVLPAMNPEPVIVTAVPPAVDPLAGDMAITVGGGAPDVTVTLSKLTGWFDTSRAIKPLLSVVSFAVITSAPS